jgi:hypothetical protein
MDLTLPEFNSEADEYYQLGESAYPNSSIFSQLISCSARASMSLHDAYDSLEVSCVTGMNRTKTWC